MPRSLPPSEPPSSLEIPGHTPSNAPYVIGIVVFAALIAVLLYMRSDGERPTPQQVVAPPPKAAETAAPAPEFAPPPPPEEEAKKDAGLDAAATATPSATARAGAAGGGSCANCNGVATAALKSAVSGRAALSRGCYNRALRRGAASGSLTVSVRVAETGGVCGASISNDTVGSPAISQCVLSNFRGATLPRPAEGCVVINVPINFQVQ